MVATAGTLEHSPQAMHRRGPPAAMVTSPYCFLWSSAHLRHGEPAVALRFRGVSSRGVLPETAAGLALRWPQATAMVRVLFARLVQGPLHQWCWTSSRLGQAGCLRRAYGGRLGNQPCRSNAWFSHRAQTLHDGLRVPAGTARRWEPHMRRARWASKAYAVNPVPVTPTRAVLTSWPARQPIPLPCWGRLTGASKALLRRPFQPGARQGWLRTATKRAWADCDGETGTLTGRGAWCCRLVVRCLCLATEDSSPVTTA